MQCGHRVAFAAAVAFAGCGDPHGSSPTVVAPAPEPEPPTASWNVVGTVRSARAGLPGVTVAVESGPFIGRATLSDDAGGFRLSAVSGTLMLSASKPGYERYLQSLSITNDVTIDIDLTRAVAADSIRLGSVIETSVSSGAPACDPSWDARAPCRRFVFVAPATGVLSVAVTWSGAPELDATLVTLTNEYVATSTEVGPGVLALSAPVTAGRTYELRVNAYYTAQVFTLRAEVR